jgi:parallel beta-helix repeat protein
VFYVDPAGTDAAGGGAGDPWRSLAASVAKLRAGDTLLARTGDYAPVNAHLTGTAGAWITVAAEPGNSPRIVGANTNELFLIADSQYVDLRGFELAGSPDDHSNTGGVAIDRSHHVRVSALQVHDVPSGGISGVGSSHVQIERNTVWNTSFWSGYATSGISFYEGSMSGGANGDGYTDYVRNNVVYGIYNKVNSQWDGTHTDGNCIIIDRHDDVGYAGATLIQNNLCHDNGGRGVHVFRSSNVTAVNNTVVNNNLDPVIGRAGAGELSALYASNVVFRNNLVVAGGGSRIMLFQASGITLDSNLYVGAPEHPGANDIVVGDPVISSYRPQAGSPAIDAGSATAAPSTDIRGATRRGAPDVGAYES